MTVIHSLYLFLSLSLTPSISIYLSPSYFSFSPSLPPSLPPLSRSLYLSRLHTLRILYISSPQRLTFCTSSPPTQANIDILGEPADAQGASKMGTFASLYSSELSSVRYFYH